MGASEVKEDLQWGKGPQIKIVQLDIYKNCVGQYNINDPSSLLIDVDFVNDLENTTFGSQNADALSFLIGATVLHEYVHFSEWRDKSWNSSKDSGILFENEVYGRAVWRTKDAKLILRGNK